MSTTPYAAAAGAARQRIAGSLGTLQQDPNVPPAVLEIVAGLARAMGPLFQLERGSQDTTLFAQARTVLQETLARMQTVDQGYPGVADATGAIAGALGTIFQAMREAGVVQGSGVQPNAGAPAAAGPVRHPTPPPQPAVAPPSPPASPPAAARGGAPVVKGHPPPSPNEPNFTGTARSSPQVAAASPFPLRASSTGMAAQSPPGGAAAQVRSVPQGASGLPRLEAEIGVHSETNFFTDFLGDIRNHGGIFVATFHVLAIGTACEVILTFPGNLTAELRGLVKWKRETEAARSSVAASPGLGIEITNAPPEAWNLIDRFMRKREPIMHEM